MLPQKLSGSVMSGATNTLLLLGMTAQVEEIANDLIGIVGFCHDSILERDGVIFAGRTGYSDALGGHHFKSNQAKGFVSTICQSGIGGSIGCTHKLFRQEETQIIEVGRTSMFDGINTLLQIRTMRLHIADYQTTIIGVAKNLRSMRLNAPTHKERDRIAALLQARYGLDGHQPALVGIETSDFEEEETPRIALAGNRTQAL